MVALKPRQGVRHEEAPDLVAPVVEDQRAPIHVRALTRISVLVEVRAVELRQRERVPREVRGHPVEDHADAARVQVVDEPREVLRRAVAVRRRVEPRDLVTPRAVERMLRQRHHLDVREAHLEHVVRQLRRDLPVGERTIAILGHTPPRTEVHLVDRHRPVKPAGLLAAAFHPRVVRPAERRRVAHDRGVVGRPLEVRAVRIGLQPQMTTHVPDLELVQLTLP